MHYYNSNSTDQEFGVSYIHEHHTHLEHHSNGAVQHQTGVEEYQAGSSSKPFYDWNQAAEQISRWNAKWDGGDFGTSGSATYSFSQYSGNGFFPMTPSGRELAMEALRIISEVSNLSFSEVFQSGELILYQYGTSPYGGGYGGWNGHTRHGDEATTITSGEANMGGESLSLFLHEIGHAIGLAHPGDYDGGASSYANNASFWNDTEQYSVMSYWDAHHTGGDFNSLQITNLMLYDIAALQKLYGANNSTRTGDTVYGFNSTALKSTNGTIDDKWRLSNSNDDIVGAVWDAGGIDTLDLSGFSSSSEIDLRQEGFSSFGGLSNNFSIARNVVVENAIGGFGADTIIGNTAGNSIKGGAGADSIKGGGGNDRIEGGLGADVIDGGSGFDTVSYVSSAGAVNVSLYLDRGYGQWDAKGDRFVSDTIEALRGSSHNDILVGDDGRNDRLLGGLGNDSLRGNGGNDTLYGEGGNDLLFSGFGIDSHFGGNGFDTLMFTGANAGVIANLNMGQGLLGHAQGDTYHGVEGLQGSVYRDVLIGDGKNNVLGGRGGNDAIDGKGGYDLLTGGQGDDKFVFAPGYQGDRISDFDDQGNDLIDLIAFGFSSYAQVRSLMNDTGNDIRIDFGNGDALRLEGTEFADLSSSDFILA